MTYTIIDATSLPAAAGPHPAASPYDKRVGEALGLSAFEMYQVELPPSGETVSHHHQGDQAEDAYAIIRGDGWLVVDGDEVPLATGHFIAVTTESTRHVRAGGEGLVLIAVCASPAAAKAPFA